MKINYEIHDSVVTITLERPEALNAMDQDAYAELTALLARFDREPGAEVGIITGAGGRAFSAGADLKRMHGEAAEKYAWGPWRPYRWDLGLTISKPMIAAIDGYALAGGLELALLCDLRIATPASQFGAPEVKWNILHGFGASRLPITVGIANAMFLLLTGEMIDAAEALRIGLVNRLVETEELLPVARQLATTIAANGSDAVRMTKELALRSSLGEVEHAMRLYTSYMSLLEGGEEQQERTRGFAARSGSADDDGA